MDMLNVLISVYTNTRKVAVTKYQHYFSLLGGEMLPKLTEYHETVKENMYILRRRKYAMANYHRKMTYIGELEGTPNSKMSLVEFSKQRPTTKRSAVYLK